MLCDEQHSCCECPCSEGISSGLWATLVLSLVSDGVRFPLLTDSLAWLAAEAVKIALLWISALDWHDLRQRGCGPCPLLI